MSSEVMSWTGIPHQDLTCHQSHPSSGMEVQTLRIYTPATGIGIWEYRPYKLLWKQGQVGLQGWVVDPGSIYGHKNNKYFSNSDILFLDCIGWQKKTWINQSQAILHLATCCWFAVLVRYFLKGGLWWGGRVWSTTDWTFIDLSM